VRYARAADVAYISIKDTALGEFGHRESNVIDVDPDQTAGQIFLDLDAEGRLIGIEVVGALNGLPRLLDELDEMRATSSPSSDAACIYLKNIGAGESRHQVMVDDEEPAGEVIIDLDAERRLIGIEILRALEGLPKELLEEAESR
jgi:uncharacterized protein YuzE